MALSSQGLLNIIWWRKPHNLISIFADVFKFKMWTDASTFSVLLSNIILSQAESSGIRIDRFFTKWWCTNYFGAFAANNKCHTFIRVVKAAISCSKENIFLTPKFHLKSRLHRVRFFISRSGRIHLMLLLCLEAKLLYLILRFWT